MANKSKYKSPDELEIRINPAGDEETIYSDDEEVLNDDVMQAMSPEMQNYQRSMVSPQHVVSKSDLLRVNDDTLTNMAGSEPLMADSPEDSRAKAAIVAIARGSDIRDKSILGNDPIGLDQGATHSESVTGTGAIAAPPGFVAKRRSKMNEKQRKIVNEWSPEFAAGDYKPGDATMPKLGGNGLVNKTSNQLKVGKFKTETDAHGEPFGMKRKTSIGMAVANDEGVVVDPQGEHKSSHGDPAADDCCDPVGHDWPDEPKHRGSISEPVVGHSYGAAAIKGGSVAEEGWTPKNFAKFLGEDADIQRLFDNYAKTVPHVCKEDFQTLVNANGLGIVIDNVSLNTLMAKNSDFTFYANEDANGPYFTPINEMVGADAVGYATPPAAEQEMSEEEGNGYAAQPEAEGDDSAWLKKFVDEDDMDSGDAPDHMKDSMPFGLPSRKTGESMGKMIRGDEKAGFGADEEHEDKLPPAPPLEFNIGESKSRFNHRAKQKSSQYEMRSDIKESIARFITRANLYMEAMTKQCQACGNDCSGDCEECPKCMHGELKEKPGQQRELPFGESVGAAMNAAWDREVGPISVRKLTKFLREGLANIQTRVPAFKPLVESTGMDAPKGKGLKGGDGPKEDLPDQPTDFKEVGTKDNLIKRKPVNSVEKTPVVPGTGKGMSTESVLKKNIQKIIGRVNTRLAESKLPKYNKVQYCTMVEGKRGKMHRNVGDAAADAEEMLQHYRPSDVNISTVFTNAAGGVIMRKDIPLFTIDSRGPFVNEGKALFRFKVVAESYANSLYGKGYSTKMAPHNWGYAVASNAPKTIKENWAPEELDPTPGQAQKTELRNAGRGAGFTAAAPLGAPPKGFDKDGNEIYMSDEEVEAHQSGFNAAEQLAAPPKGFDKDGNEIDMSDEEVEAHQSGHNCGYSMPEDITADDLPKEHGDKLPPAPPLEFNIGESKSRFKRSNR